MLARAVSHASSAPCDHAHCQPLGSVPTSPEARHQPMLPKPCKRRCKLVLSQAVGARLDASRACGRGHLDLSFPHLYYRVVELLAYYATTSKSTLSCTLFGTRTS